MTDMQQDIESTFITVESLLVEFSKLSPSNELIASGLLIDTLFSLGEFYEHCSQEETAVEYLKLCCTWCEKDLASN
jgi:hypothetical protein